METLLFEKIMYKLNIFIFFKQKMSYKHSAKNRRVKRVFEKMLRVIRFEWLALPNSLKIIVVGVIIAFFGLFGNWIDSTDVTGQISANSFFGILGMTGVILSFFHILVLFLIFGNHQKEKYKNFFHLKAQDSVIIFLCMLFMLLITINSVFIIGNLEMFRSNIILGKWIIFTLVWYTLWLFGSIAYLMTKTKTTLFVDDDNSISGEQSHKPIYDKNNMKLPF